MENSEQRVGVGQQSDPLSQSLTNRKRAPATASLHPWDIMFDFGGVKEEWEDAYNDEPEATANGQPAKEGLISVRLSDVSVLDCPVCYEPLDLPVFQCGNGHVICSICRDRIKQKCPSCSKKVGNAGCRAIENVLEAVKVHCSYKGCGCPTELSYSSKRSHQENCAYAPFGCLFDKCNFIGCQKQLSLHMNNAHAKSVIGFRFDQTCQFAMRKAEKFIVFREEVNGTLFILNKHVGMPVSCIGGANVSVGARFAYALVVIGEDSCLRFQSLTSRFENTPTGKGDTFSGPSKDFVEVPSYLFGYEGCLKLKLCVWRKDAPTVDIANGVLGEAH